MHTDALPALAVTNQPDRGLCHHGEGEALRGKKPMGSGYLEGRMDGALSSLEEGEGDLLKATRIGWEERQRG